MGQPVRWPACRLRPVEPRHHLLRTPPVVWDALPAWGGATAAAAAAAAASAAAPAAPYVTFTPETIAGDAPPPSPSGFCGDHGWIA